MDVQLVTEEDYNQLKPRVFRIAYSHRYTKQEAEDVFHDILVEILEFQIPKTNWGKTISKVFGLNRTRRYREFTRRGEE